MTTPDVPEAVVPQALYDQLRPIVDTHLDQFEAHIRADERARVLGEVQAVLLKRPGPFCDCSQYDSDPMDPATNWTVPIPHHYDCSAHVAQQLLRDTVGAGGDGEG